MADGRETKKSRYWVGYLLGSFKTKIKFTDASRWFVVRLNKLLS
jgi:hypothetical protein